MKSGNRSKLLGGLLLIFLFVFWIAPSMQRLPYVEEVHACVRENNIDATALIYSDIDEFGDADVSIRDSMKY